MWAECCGVGGVLLCVRSVVGWAECCGVGGVLWGGRSVVGWAGGALSLATAPYSAKDLHLTEGETFLGKLHCQTYLPF